MTFLYQCQYCQSSFTSDQDRLEHEEICPKNRKTEEERFNAKKEQTKTIPEDKYLRLAADFDNYRKRTEQELGSAIKFANQAVLLDIADAIDVMEKAFALTPTGLGNEVEHWLLGLTHLKPMLEGILDKNGVKRMDITNHNFQVFDPSLMEAVAVVPGGQSQTIREQLRAGYTMHGRVIRPARVIIYE